jgi:acetate kinase
MPLVAQRYALPRELFDEGIRRYGFHGLSYEYVVQELCAHDDDALACRRAVIAHLGNGASMVAVRDGRSVDTSMGFTPVAGLVMGTRSGDIDPGITPFLQQHKGMSAADVNALINKQSGLLGVSGASSDMEDLLERAPTDPRSGEAIALFCYQARKYIGAYAAVLGGLDTLAFTGGIGENAASIRAGICDGLEFLGIVLDAERNAAHAPIISRDDSAVAVRVVKTNEDLMIARHARRVLDNTAA